MEISARDIQFNLFDKVYILTYIFEASIIKYYFDLYNISYEKKSISNIDGNYCLTDYYDPDRSYYKSLINIYDGNLNDNIPQKITGYSKSWYRKCNTEKKTKIKNNIYNYFRNYLEKETQTSTTANSIMWTTFNDYWYTLKGKKYGKRVEPEDLQKIDSTYGFLACNSRATNKYSGCYNLAYCVNRYINPEIKQFFAIKNIAMDEDLYALSEMIQWIWRSRIRNNQPINIYIPSTRMRLLLNQWLDNELLTTK